MTPRKTFSLLVALILIIFGYLSVFTVQEGQQALLVRFGQIVTHPKSNNPYIFHSGLHFKWPFIYQVQTFDTRLQTLDVQSSRLLTSEQKYLLVDYYAKWRISNLALYFTRTNGDADLAASLLQQKINDILRAEIGLHTINEVVTDQRLTIMQDLQSKSNASAQELGISIVDVRIRSIDLPQEVSQSVFARMSADREKVAASHRANGQAQATALRAQANAQAVVIVATAKANAEKIRGDGEAQAAEIYAQAYSKNPEFYAFYRSLQAYKNTINDQNTILVVKPDSQFFGYFNSPQSKTAPASQPVQAQ